jgi:predicted RND superfamily exporter protein
MGLLKKQGLWLLALIVLVAVTGIPQLQTSTHYSVYFDEKSDSLIAHREIAKNFRNGDSVLVVLKARTDDFSSEDNYFMLEDLTNQLTNLAHVISLNSISTLGIAGDAFASDGLPFPSKDQLQSHPMTTGLLLSNELDLAAIEVGFQLPDNKAETVLGTMNSIQRLLDPYVAAQSVETHYSGTLTMNAAYIDVVRKDMKTIFPLLLLVMIVLLTVLLKSLRAMSTILPVAVLSVLSAFGVMGWYGVSLAAINSFVPVMILSISIAACVHMMTAYAQYRVSGLSPGASALAARAANVLPLSLASVTTVLGFLGLLLSPSPPVRLIGLLVATGVSTSYLLCLTLVPALQTWLDPVPARRGPQPFQLDKLAKRARQYDRKITLIFLVLLIPAGWLSMKNIISDNVFEYFPSTHPFYQDTLLVEQRFSGINRVLYSINDPAPQSVLTEKFIKDSSRFSDWLKQQPEVNRVSSLLDLKQIQEARRQGRLQDRLSHYRALFSEPSATPLSLPGVSADLTSAMLSVYLLPLDSAQMVAFDRRVNTWFETHLPGYQFKTGGPTLLFAYLGESNIRGMLLALSAGLLIASVLMGITLRSFRIAIIAFFCNIFPVLLIYAIWAMSNGRISLGAAVVMGMIMGIVVDDTIFLLSKYKQGLQSGQPDAVTYALGRVGPALIITTISLVVGLGLGLLSDFGPIWNMS